MDSSRIPIQPTISNSAISSLSCFLRSSRYPHRDKFLLHFVHFSRSQTRPSRVTRLCLGNICVWVIYGDPYGHTVDTEVDKYLEFSLRLATAILDAHLASCWTTRCSFRYIHNVSFDKIPSQGEGEFPTGQKYLPGPPSLRARLSSDCGPPII